MQETPKPNSALIEQQVKKAKQLKSTFLDLGKCGLTHLYDLLNFGDLDWVEELNLGEAYGHDQDLLKQSENKGAPNDFSSKMGGLQPLLKLPNLKGMYFYKTILSPEAILTILELNNLEKLNLYGHKLDKEAIERLGRLQKLTHLNLNECGINDAGVESISQLNNLVNLRLYKNEITKEGAQKLTNLRKNLKKLWIGFNKLEGEGARHLARLSELEVLSVKHNNIGDFGLEGLTALRKLQYINIGANGLTSKSMPVISKFKKLEKLVLNGNDVTSVGIGKIGSLSLLKSLELANNRIDDLKFLSQFPQLERLYIVNNQIKYIYTLSDSSNLGNIDLKGNPVVDCPADVWQTNDIRQIRAFFGRKQSEYLKTVKGKREVETHDKINISFKEDVELKALSIQKQEPEGTRDVKLILLGNSNAGKTTLVHYLKKGSFLRKRKTTHGLEVIQWKPDPSRFPSLTDVTVNIWDFGGQEYYHEAYRLFLSSNAVYSVVWCNETNKNSYFKTKLRDGETEVDLAHFELDYWLDTVRSNGDSNEGKDLLLIQTKTDIKGNEKSRISQEVHENYRIADTFHLSFKKGRQKKYPIEQQRLKLFEAELDRVLKNAADRTPGNESWIKIREIVGKVTKTSNSPFTLYLNNKLGWISLDNFYTVSNRLINGQLSEDEKYTIPRWLDRTGAALYFEHNTRLNDRIFLNPKLLSNRIYEKLTEDMLNRQGELTFNLNNECDDESLLRELLLDLDLIFLHPQKLDEDVYLAPQYLPDKHPVEDLFKIASEKAWQSSLWLKVPMFFYKKVLNNLIFHYAKDEQTDARYFWKHGILFMKNQHRILIKGLYPENSERDGKIIISVEEGELEKSLEKEIFDVARQSMSNIPENEHLKETEQPLPNKKLDATKQAENSFEDEIDSRLKISCDNIYYASYTSLLNALEKQEPQVEALRCQSSVENVDFDRKIIPIKPFASILPEQNLLKTKRVFLSYSHRNTHWLNRIRVHLSGLKHSKYIEDWTDQEILPGELWDDRILENIQKADLFILLLSADFVASDYIWKQELPQILKNKRGQVIPVLIEPFDFVATSVISEKEMIPKESSGENLMAVSLWDNPEKALAVVAQKIRSVVVGQNDID